MVALNADDGCDGPIEDIQIDGVFGENSLRAVRLLSTKSPISRISVSNVFGTYYQNCIVLAYFYPRTGVRGKMNHISIRNIYGNNAHRIPEYNKGDDSFYSFSFIWVDNDVDIDFLAIDNMCRNEEISGVETIRVCEKAHIKNLSLSNILQQNSTNFEFPLFTNYGTIYLSYGELTSLDAFACQSKFSRIYLSVMSFRSLVNSSIGLSSTVFFVPVTTSCLLSKPPISTADVLTKETPFSYSKAAKPKSSDITPSTLLHLLRGIILLGFP